MGAQSECCFALLRSEMHAGQEFTLAGLVLLLGLEPATSYLGAKPYSVLLLSTRKYNILKLALLFYYSTKVQF